MFLLTEGVDTTELWTSAVVVQGHVCLLGLLGVGEVSVPTYCCYSFQIYQH
jgi:hypothetical protein